MSRTVTWFRETATFGDGMPERVVNQWLEARMALHTPVCGATTCRPRTITWSRMHWPSQFRRSTRLLPPSSIITSFWTGSRTMVPAVPRAFGPGPRAVPARSGPDDSLASLFSGYSGEFLRAASRDGSRSDPESGAAPASARFAFDRATLSSFSAANVTGPSKPDSSNGESCLKGFHVVQVIRFSTGNAWSPISRFGHRFATVISNWLSRVFTAAVMSTRHGAHQTTPRS